MKDYKNKKWLENEYLIEKKSIHQIAKKCNISSDTIIRYWLVKFNIPRRSISDANKGCEGNQKGKKLSDETKKKIREGNKNKIISEETKRKISDAKKGKKLSEETKKKIGKANKGRKLSDNAKRNIRIGAIKRIEKNNGKMFPNFNKKSVIYFKKFDEENNTKGLYGKNEFHIRELGYWTDYINFNLRLIIEWDEEKHYKNDKLRKKDIQRQKEIQNYFPDFKFKRIREKFMKLNYV